jgi:hypothetical protein
VNRRVCTQSHHHLARSVFQGTPRGATVTLAARAPAPPARPGAGRAREAAAHAATRTAGTGTRHWAPTVLPPPHRQTQTRTVLCGERERERRPCPHPHRRRTSRRGNLVGNVLERRRAQVIWVGRRAHIHQRLRRDDGQVSGATEGCSSVGRVPWGRWVRRRRRSRTRRG